MVPVFQGSRYTQCCTVSSSIILASGTKCRAAQVLSGLGYLKMRQVFLFSLAEWLCNNSRTFRYLLPDTSTSATSDMASPGKGIYRSNLK